MGFYNSELSVYMQGLKHHSVLSAEEERVLFLKIQQGSMIAREKFISCNLRLVIKIAKSFLYRGLDFEDLIAEGNLGLFRALSRFDFSRGIRFATYATWWVKEAIQSALLNNSQMVRLPIYMTSLLRKWKKGVEVLRNRNHQEPSVSEVGQLLKLSKEKTNLVQRAIKVHNISLGSASANSDTEDFSSLDIVEDKRIPSPDKKLFDDGEKSKLSSLLRVLSPKESEVIKLRFGVDGRKTLTLKELGLKLGVSFERIRQLESQALKKLRYLFKEPIPRQTG